MPFQVGAVHDYGLLRCPPSWTDSARPQGETRRFNGAAGATLVTFAAFLWLVPFLLCCRPVPPSRTRITRASAPLLVLLDNTFLSLGREHPAFGKISQKMRGRNVFQVTNGRTLDLYRPTPPPEDKDKAKAA